MNTFVKNGKNFVRIPQSNWNRYLDINSPNRLVNKSIKCSLKNSNESWCSSCNTFIGNWSKSCVNKITSINLIKYERILNEINTNDKFYFEIEIDNNDNNNTI